MPLQANTVGADLKARTVTQLFWHLLPFLFLLYIVNYLDRINVGFAALEMQAQLGFSDRVYGLGAGIFFAGYFFFQVPSNLAMARVGARRWIAALMFLWGVISCCMIFVRSAHGFYQLRFTLGMAEAGFFPGIVLYLKNWFPGRARARAMALFMTAIPLAGVVGGPISGALLELHTRPLAGWQWLFLLEGAPAVLLGLATLKFISERPQEVRWLSPDERGWLLSELQREAETHPDAKRNWPAVFSSAKVWLLTSVYFGMTSCIYGLVYFLPKMLHAASAATSFAIGLLTIIPFLAAASAMVLAGMHSDRRGEQRRHIAALALVGAAGASIAGLVSSTTATVVFLTLAFSGSFAMLGPFWALSSAVLSESTAGAGIALINCVGNLGGFLGPYSIGWLRTVSGSYRSGMIAIASALLCAGGVALLVSTHAQTFSFSRTDPLQLGASPPRASGAEPSV
jgi:MFS transporter, ACS family, tartrate transporter